jgi:hypothetical protein
MPDCLHESFESLVTVSLVTPHGLPPAHQARLQVRCAQCQGLLTMSGLPPVNAVLAQTVAVGAGGAEVYLSGTVVPPSPAQEAQAWTRVATPEPTPPQPA